MTTDLINIARRLGERFPHLDIRTDQCDTVRIVTRGAMVALVHEKGVFKVDVVAFGDTDFEDDLVKSMSEGDPRQFEETVAEILIGVAK